MEQNAAAEHLQVIRTLMERSALYRRALAPLMIFAGGLGIVAAAVAYLLRIESSAGFLGYWMATAFLGGVGALLLVRRQALKSAEPFWSPPTRRVAQAMLPAFTAGLVVGVLFLIVSLEAPTADPPTGMADDRGELVLLAALWAVLYGCALHAAGFFASRGLRLFGWLFVVAGCGVLLGLLVLHRQDQPDASWQTCHGLMGCLFGLSHLAYGVYLHFTETSPTA